jgi:VWFA-related protein
VARACLDCAGAAANRAVFPRYPVIVATASSFITRVLRRQAGLQAIGVVALSVTAATAPQRTVFRSDVDVIAVDVQVVDRDGNPIDRIGPESFDVSINGQRRKVQSAQFLRHAVNEVKRQSVGPAGEVLDNSTTQEGEGRTFVVAIDSGSFEVGSERAPMEGARGFIQHLNPSDRVGLFVYPSGAKIAPTTARAAVGISLDRVIGQKDPLRSHYNLRPWEVIDIASRSTTPSSFLTASRILNEGLDPATQAIDPVLQVQARECPSDPDCPAKIYAEGMGLATQLERQVQASLSGLDALLHALTDLPGRKAVIFVSAGIIVSDRPDGRPDAGSLARTMGQAAARANATVYTVHIDTTTSGAGPASQKGQASANVSRDRALSSNWLNDFSNAAGGQLIYVPTGSSDFAFDRVLRETSAYYLLGVEPAPADRDGQPRQLRVKVHRRGVSVRSRQWVVIPVRS